MAPENKWFTMESWNHPCFNRPYYHMVWGPFPISMWKDIENTIIANFDKEVKYLRYKHAEIRS